MIIRKAVSEDAEKIAKVLINSYNMDSIEEGKYVFLDEIKKDHYYIIAEEEGEVLGIVSWRVQGLHKHQLAELYRIAVLPDLRGKGVSKQLFEEMIKNIKECYESNNSKLRKLHLYVHGSNERAQKFYKKMGFMHEATLKDHYYPGEDEFVLSMFFD